MTRNRHLNLLPWLSLAIAVTAGCSPAPSGGLTQRDPAGADRQSAETTIVAAAPTTPVKVTDAPASRLVDAPAAPARSDHARAAAPASTGPSPSKTSEFETSYTRRARLHETIANRRRSLPTCRSCILIDRDWRDAMPLRKEVLQ